MIIKASLKNAPVLQPEKRERTLFFLSVVTSWTHRCSLFCTPGAKYNTHTYTLNHGEIRPQLQRIMMFTLFPPRPPGYFILCRYLTLSASLSLPPSSCPQMFLTVYLSNNDQHFTEVPVTPETLCRDVVELCKEPGETDCHLSEMWRGSGEWRCQFTQCYPSTRNEQCFSVTCCFVYGVWLYAKGQETLCNFVFLLIRRKWLFWSRSYMEISCVVNCLVFSKGLFLLGLQCKWSEAYNPCYKHKHPDSSHLSGGSGGGGGGGGWAFKLSPFSPISQRHKVFRIKTQGARLRGCFHGDAVFEYFHK